MCFLSVVLFRSFYILVRLLFVFLCDKTTESDDDDNNKLLVKELLDSLLEVLHQFEIGRFTRAFHLAHSVFERQLYEDVD